MFKESKIKESVNMMVFSAWIGLMRLTCLLFLIIQSQALGPNFTFYCIAIMSLAKPVLSNLTKFRESGKQSKKIYTWLFMVFLTTFVAYIWGQNTSTEDSAQTAMSYIIMALETTVIISSTHGIVWMVNWFSEKRKRRLSGSVNKLV